MVFILLVFPSFPYIIIRRCSSERPQAKKSQENLQRRSKFHEASSLKTN